jgi:hypothetical protein
MIVHIWQPCAALSFTVSRVVCQHSQTMAGSKARALEPGNARRPPFSESKADFTISSGSFAFRREPDSTFLVRGSSTKASVVTAILPHTFKEEVGYWGTWLV